MKHRHHVVPRYEGGTNQSNNLVYLTPVQHAMWHYAEWSRKGNWQDYFAWKGLAGLIGKEEIHMKIASLNGLKLREWAKNNSETIKDRSLLAKPKPPEVKQKISDSIKKYRAEHKIPRIPPPVGSRGIRGRRPKPVELLSPCGLFAFVFESAVKAGETLDLNPSAITKCARGVWKQTQGWRVRYI